jgi:isoprenylcysteine carboxyl methyltransferase (ICMT) family protein YpbQ
MNTNDWIGTVGVFLILIAYFLSTFNWLSSQGRLFFALNAVGAAMSCFASYLIRYWPFFVLEGTWTVVSLIGWIKARE